MNPSLTWSTDASQYVQVEIQIERPRNAHSLVDHPVIVENNESSDTSLDEEGEDSTAIPSDSSAERCCNFSSNQFSCSQIYYIRDSDLERFAMRPRVYD